MTSKTLIGSLLALSSLAMTTVALSAEPSGHPGTAKEDLSYQGAPIAMDPSASKDLIGGDGPPMTTAEFDRAKQIFSSAAPVATGFYARAPPVNP